TLTASNHGGFDLDVQSSALRFDTLDVLVFDRLCDHGRIAIHDLSISANLREGEKILNEIIHPADGTFEHGGGPLFSRQALAERCSDHSDGHKRPAQVVGNATRKGIEIAIALFELQPGRPNFRLAGGRPATHPDA